MIIRDLARICKELRRNNCHPIWLVHCVSFPGYDCFDVALCVRIVSGSNTLLHIVESTSRPGLFHRKSATPLECLCH